MRVLLVEDEEVLAETIRQVLHADGFAVDLAFLRYRRVVGDEDDRV
ncbi:hypothetical protein [Dactylosporangium sp. CA-139066]